MVFQRIFGWFSNRSRQRRAATLASFIKPEPDWRILDLGGGTGEHIHRVFPNCRNITVCDYSAADLAIARDRFGYTTIQADGSDRLPFADGEFDLVFCSSVIEHVTGPKDSIIKMTNGREFQNTAFHFQQKFAAEIRRVGKRYYVQTPHRYFIIESHTWLPLIIVLLPRPLQIRTIAFFNRFWPKQTEPDWNLLVPSQMKHLFPDAKLILERSGWMPKSIMAIRG